MKNTFGKKIRQLRIEKDLTLEELAEKASISSRRLQDIELEKMDTKTETLINIAAALETSIGYLIGETNTA